MERSPDHQKRLEQLDDILREQGIDLSELEKRQVDQVSYWQTGIKNKDNEFETHPMAGMKLKSKSVWNPPNIEANPTEIRPTRAKGRVVRGLGRAAILPDMQMAWERHEEGYEQDLVPTHDESAIETCLGRIKDTQPDLIIMNGDNLDFPEFSSFNQEKRYQFMLQHTLNGVHELMAKIRANAPEARIIWIEGNHEERLQRKIGRDVMQLLGVKRPGDSEPMLSIPHMLRLEELGIEWLGGYPANAFWINKDLKVIHGNTVSSRGSTAARIANDSSVSVLFGHVHRREYHARRVEVSSGEPKTIVAASAGTLADINGRVASHGSAVNESGRPMPHIENWQRGMGEVLFNEEKHHISLLEINEDYEMVADGKLYTPR